jgi:hypothetical protein
VHLIRPAQQAAATAQPPGHPTRSAPPRLTPAHRSAPPPPHASRPRLPAPAASHHHAACFPIHAGSTCAPAALAPSSSSLHRPEIAGPEIC